LREVAAKLAQENVSLREGVAAAGGKADGSAPALPALALDKIKAAKAQEVSGLFDTLAQAEQDVAAKLVEENKKLFKQLGELKKQQALSAGGDAKKEMVGSIGFIGKAFDGLDPKELRGVAEGLMKQAEAGVVVVASLLDGKASLVVAVSKELSSTVSAVTLVQAAVAELGGKGGGGRPDMAQGGGPEADKIDTALSKIKALLAA